MKEKTTTETILAIGIGSKHSWPLQKMSSIRSFASQLSLIHGRKYTTWTDKKKKKVYVTRVS